MNFYEFVRGNPINAIDPFGLEHLNINDTVYDVEDGEISNVFEGPEGYGKKYRKESANSGENSISNANKSGVVKDSSGGSHDLTNGEGQNPQPFNQNKDGGDTVKNEVQSQILIQQMGHAGEKPGVTGGGSSLGGGFIFTVEGGVITIASTAATAVGNNSVPLKSHVENNDEDDGNGGGSGGNDNDNPQNIKNKKLLERYNKLNKNDRSGKNFTQAGKQVVKDN